MTASLGRLLAQLESPLVLRILVSTGVVLAGMWWVLVA